MNKPESSAHSSDLFGFTEALNIAAHLSKDIRDGESLVAWVKRVIKEREEARAALRLVIRQIYFDGTRSSATVRISCTPGELAEYGKAAGLGNGNANNPNSVIASND